MSGYWPPDNKPEHNMWREWHLSTSELSADTMLELHRNLSSKESVINANSPRDAPRIVVGKRRYMDVADVPEHLRNPIPEISELPADSYYQPVKRSASMPKRDQDYSQHQEIERSFSSPSYFEKPNVSKSGHGLHFSIEKGLERGSRVSAKAKVRFPSIASRLDRDRDRDSSSSRLTERNALSLQRPIEMKLDEKDIA